jgi:hypothetical protein
LQNVPAVELDSRLRYTQWNEVLSQSKHNLVKTYQFTREPERAASNSLAAVAAARDQDPELTNTLMCLCILVV